ncbi:hypothetical protein F5Y06DRAFT_278561 [Hypoxylon sp. FL0890]|nr:hypothetical protein F5Y06DRAFT_278561 [Hypoxylon sp. FL0890]
MSATVYISIYKPSDERDPNHWAIYIQNGQEGVILQVADDKGGIGYYVDKPIYNKQPQRSQRHETSIPVGTIKSENYEAAVAAIQATPVDNESTTWNCQAWAMEALDALEEAELFVWDQKGKAQAKARRQEWQ